MYASRLICTLDTHRRWADDSDEEDEEVAEGQGSTHVSQAYVIG